MKKYIISALMLLLSLALISCKEDISFKVNFDPIGGSTVDSVLSDKNGNIQMPEDPSKPFYAFAGWYKTIDYSGDVVNSIGKNQKNDLTLYAKWRLLEYTMSFNSNGGSNVEKVIRTGLDLSIYKPEDPKKEGFDFKGWYKEVNLVNIYIFDIPLNEDIILYAKWEEKDEEVSEENTLVLPIFSSYYGNTNGNLNNKGLAVYDFNRALHYLSINSSLYSYDPKTDVTTLVFNLISGGRPTFLNLDEDVLYFIDSSDGHLLSYNLIDELFLLISDTENIYASLTQNWVNFIYPTVMYETNYVAFQRYLIDSKTLSNVQGYGYEQVNIEGTRVYYKPIDQFSLNLMNYNGQGKSTIVYLNSFDVTNQFESLLYKVDQDYTTYYALILEIGNKKGLYLYNKKDGLVKIMEGNIRNLNYDGISLYAIMDNAIYQIDIEKQTSKLFYDIQSEYTYLNVINNWLYLSSFTSSDLVRINPSTKKIENIN